MPKIKAQDMFLELVKEVFEPEENNKLNSVQVKRLQEIDRFIELISCKSTVSGLRWK